MIRRWKRIKALYYRKIFDQEDYKETYGTYNRKSLYKKIFQK